MIVLLETIIFSLIALLAGHIEVGNHVVFGGMVVTNLLNTVMRLWLQQEQGCSGCTSFLYGSRRQSED